MSDSYEGSTQRVVCLNSPPGTPPLRASPLPFNSTPIRLDNHARAQTTASRRQGTSTPTTPTETATVENEAGDPPAFFESLSANINKIRGMTVEADTYADVCYVLNYISRQVALPDGHAIIFASHPNTRPPGDYLNYGVKPDIVAYPSSGHSGAPIPPWPGLSSVCEVKCQNQRTSDQVQAVDYLRALFAYRTDLTIVYGLLWRARRLALLQGTASGIVVIRESNWQDSAWKGILYSYVVNLYNLASDDSLSYSPENDAWTIKLNSGIYIMSSFHTSVSPRRTTTVFLGWKEDDPNRTPCILKRSLLPGDTRFLEGPLFRLAHSAGNIPGLARLDAHEHVPFPPDSDCVRAYLVWSSVGMPLSQCPSVFALLIVFFDLVVTHQDMCERDVLHRDISWGNVMCRMNVREGQEGTKVSKEDVSAVQESASRNPTVLITDLDHGAQISEMAKREPRGERTGTPMFIALEVAQARPITNAPSIVPLAKHLSTLHGTTPDIDFGTGFFDEFEQKASAYHNAHFGLDYNRAVAQELTTLAHPNDSGAVVHQPRHDVESMFWLLCFALARANPKSDAPNPRDPTTEYSEFCDAMLNHLHPASLRDSRGRYLERTEEQWKAILHPNLAKLSGLLHHMGRYLAIRSFDRNNDGWGVYHAHQVFKILLLASIKTFQSGDPIPLCCHAPRYAQPLPGIRTGRSTPTLTGTRGTPPSGGSSRGGLKRDRSQAGLDDVDQKSGKRIKPDYPVEHEEEEPAVVSGEVKNLSRMLRYHNSWYYTGNRNYCPRCRESGTIENGDGLVPNVTAR